MPKSQSLRQHFHSQTVKAHKQSFASFAFWLEATSISSRHPQISRSLRLFTFPHPISTYAYSLQIHIYETYNDVDYTPYVFDILTTHTNTYMNCNNKLTCLRLRLPGEISEYYVMAFAYSYPKTAFLQTNFATYIVHTLSAPANTHKSMLSNINTIK